MFSVRDLSPLPRGNRSPYPLIEVGHLEIHDRDPGKQAKEAKSTPGRQNIDRVLVYVALTEYSRQDEDVYSRCNLST